MLLYKVLVCAFYGIVSTIQTLNSRYLFKTLGFSFYATIFLLQRIMILLIHVKQRRRLIDWRILKNIIPYSFLMSSINLLSSLCVTIMPLAAFMAFKKFVVLFVLLVSIVLKLPLSFTRVHHVCIGAIVLGGLLIGQRDIFKGEFSGYFSSILYTLLEAITLQYSSYLYTEIGIGPQDLMAANSLISLPYYIFFIFYQGELTGIINYLAEPLSCYFFEAVIFAIVLAVASQYTANAITMKISPFEKASVSNIKDMLLTFISLQYYKDFALTFLSSVGVVLCLSSSIVFSFTLIETSEAALKKDYHAHDSDQHEIEYTDDHI